MRGLRPVTASRVLGHSSGWDSPRVVPMALSLLFSQGWCHVPTSGVKAVGITGSTDRRGGRAAARLLGVQGTHHGTEFILLGALKFLVDAHHVFVGALYLLG